MLSDFIKLTPAIRKRVSGHHKYYPKLKIKGEYWENVVNDAIEEVLPNLNPVWDILSQQIGKDISLSNGIDISCKSGQIHPDQRIKISSSSLSRFSDNEKIVSYLKTTKTDDYIFCLSTFKSKKGHFEGERRYVYSVFDSNVFDYENVEWETFGKDQNLRGRNPNNVTITCTKAMGYQVWYYIPRNLALFTTDIIV